MHAVARAKSAEGAKRAAKDTLAILKGKMKKSHTLNKINRVIKKETKKLGK
jgi:hypothetical protein